MVQVVVLEVAVPMEVKAVMVGQETMEEQADIPVQITRLAAQNQTGRVLHQAEQVHNITRQELQWVVIQVQQAVTEKQ
jgi:hypothetical protein